MKICHLAAPALVWSQDDTSTLLSMKMQMHSTLAAGVDQLLESVGSRNVTQMSALIQDLVEETISEDGPYVGLDGDVTQALEMIKTVLLGDIRGALKEAHCFDQVDLHDGIKCFAECENNKEVGAASCVEPCDGTAHQKCRTDLLSLYKTHIEECRALDSFVSEFIKTCPEFEKKCCLLSHTTWNCGDFKCQSEIENLGVDASTGTWLNTQITKFKTAHKTWETMHGKCADAYNAYVQKDAECDCEQATCETTNCQYENCHYLNCEDVYNKCWGSCEDQYKRIVESKECLEKDRKIDWSATEKIECFVNVLLERPDNQTLLEHCGTDDCYNEYRKQMYHKCNTICREVDFDSGEITEHDRREHKKGAFGGKITEVKDQTTHQEADADVTDEGTKSVRTRHRAQDASEEARCTSHLDLDYQLPPCCHPCEPRQSHPCEGADDHSNKESYMWVHYLQYGFLNETTVQGMPEEKCHSGEHTQAYAYNLCPCVDCGFERIPLDQFCTDDKKCAPEGYNYGQHDIKVDCRAASTDVDED